MVSEGGTGQIADMKPLVNIRVLRSIASGWLERKDVLVKGKNSGKHKPKNTAREVWRHSKSLN